MINTGRFMPLNNTIAVAMSGGVDSSAVAALLRAEGHELIGLTLQLWNQRRLAGRQGMPETVQGRCCSIDDVYDARRVAEHLDIPYYLVNAQDRFEEEVVRPFVAEYLAGRTPIPCTLCNNHLKFDQLLLTAQGIGADRIATGHYARNRFDEARNRWILSRPADKSKDQTYFLFGLTQHQLSRTLFPLGEMQKPDVREMAAGHGLDLAQKPDSQEICFIPGGSYQDFLTAYLAEQGRELPDTSGDLVASNGESLGHHGRMVSQCWTRHGRAHTDALGLLPEHPERDPGQSGVAFIRLPRLEVIAGRQEIEACLFRSDAQRYELGRPKLLMGQCERQHALGKRFRMACTALAGGEGGGVLISGNARGWYEAAAQGHQQARL